MPDQASRLRNLIESKTNDKESARIIAVTSGKGGVGKTNLALNLAIGLQKAGKNVLLVDADIGLANINLLMGRVTNRSLIELANYRTRVEDVVEESNFGIKYISGVANINLMLNASSEDLRAIQRKIINAPNTIADTIVIDTGAGISRYVMDFVLFAHEVLLVTTSEPSSLSDAYSMVKAHADYGGKGQIKLVVNRVRDWKEFKDTAERLNQTTQSFLDIYVEPLGYIYEDKAVSMAVRRQDPFIVGNPDCPASRCMRELVRCLNMGIAMRQVPKGFRNILKGFFS
ncbi:MAG: AAA family ATPase [Selenomonadaceae bacterium]|nr:AAA family ATPase [Selenomonadaceae bacterium]